MRYVTGVAHDFEKASKKDRALIRKEMKVMRTTTCCRAGHSAGRGG